MSGKHFSTYRVTQCYKCCIQASIYVFICYYIYIQSDQTDEVSMAITEKWLLAVNGQISLYSVSSHTLNNMPGK
jgi:hypothetical protein